MYKHPIIQSTYICHTSWKHDKSCWWLRNKISQQSTMSEITNHHDDIGDDEFNYYSHDSCPACQDQLIAELDLEWYDDHIFSECCDFGCPECFWRQKEKRQNDNTAYKPQFKQKRKGNETKNYIMPHHLILSNKEGMTIKLVRLIYGSGVALLTDLEATSNYNQECKCAMQTLQSEWSSEKSSSLCPFLQGEVHYIGTGTWYSYGSGYSTGEHPRKWGCMRSSLASIS